MSWTLMFLVQILICGLMHESQSISCPMMILLELFHNGLGSELIPYLLKVMSHNCPVVNVQLSLHGGYSGYGVDICWALL